MILMYADSFIHCQSWGSCFWLWPLSMKLGENLCLGQADDMRLKYFKDEWFNGKQVLDIGCNIGQETCWDD